MVKDMNNKKKENINRSKFIKKLSNNVGHRNLNIITMNGVTVASICYSEVIQDEDDKDIIYLRIGGIGEEEIDSDIEDVYINYKAIRYIREFSDCIEITV